MKEKFRKKLVFIVSLLVIMTMIPLDALSQTAIEASRDPSSVPSTPIPGLVHGYVPMIPSNAKFVSWSFLTIGYKHEDNFYAPWRELRLDFSGTSSLSPWGIFLGASLSNYYIDVVYAPVRFIIPLELENASWLNVENDISWLSYAASQSYFFAGTDSLVFNSRPLAIPVSSQLGVYINYFERVSDSKANLIITLMNPGILYVPLPIVATSQVERESLMVKQRGSVYVLEVLEHPYETNLLSLVNTDSEDVVLLASDRNVSLTPANGTIAFINNFIFENPPWWLGIQPSPILLPSTPIPTFVNGNISTVSPYTHFVSPSYLSLNYNSREITYTQWRELRLDFSGTSGISPWGSFLYSVVSYDYTQESFIRFIVSLTLQNAIWMNNHNDVQWLDYAASNAFFHASKLEIYPAINSRPLANLVSLQNGVYVNYFQRVNDLQANLIFTLSNPGVLYIPLPIISGYNGNAVVQSSTDFWYSTQPGLVILQVLDRPYEYNLNILNYMSNTDTIVLAIDRTLYLPEAFGTIAVAGGSNIILPPTPMIPSPTPPIGILPSPSPPAEILSQENPITPPLLLRAGVTITDSAYNIDIIYNVIEGAINISRNTNINRMGVYTITARLPYGITETSSPDEIINALNIPLDFDFIRINDEIFTISGNEIRINLRAVPLTVSVNRYLAPRVEIIRLRTLLSRGEITERQFNSLVGELGL